jgi:SAM-dependent methyltransferase
MLRFHYQEPEWYRFGIAVGLRNLRVNRLRLGLKKTAGKILQPINYYTRFPEYALFGRALDAFAAAARPGQRLAVLDIGSPKLFGLHLAHTYAADAHLTDISRANIDEYTLLWQSIAGEACGTVDFARADGRSLPYAAMSFDVVYAMSVIEHIDGDEPERRVLSEMLRVLRPGGLLLLSVPFGQRAIAQQLTGFSYVADQIGSEQRYFFQRIYDADLFERQIASVLRPQLEPLQLWTVARAEHTATHAFHSVMPRLGEQVGGLLGFLNPLWSALINRDYSGVYPGVQSVYEQLHSHHDIYGDLVVAGLKRQAPQP